MTYFDYGYTSWLGGWVGGWLVYRCQVYRCTGVQVFGRDRKLDFGKCLYIVHTI